MKFISAAIAISTLASSHAASSSSSAVSDAKRLRNIHVYKSEKNGAAAREGQSFNDARVLQFLDVGVSLSLSVDFSLPDTTDAPSVALITTAAPSSASPTSLAPSSAAPTSLAPTTIVTGAKGGVTVAPVSSAPSTAAPFATVIETPIVVSSPPSTSPPVSAAPSTAAPVASSSSSTTCTFCEGYAINTDFIITGSDVTCGQVYDYAPTVLTGSDECANVQLAEAVCCILDMPSNLVDDAESMSMMSYNPSPSPTIMSLTGSDAPTVSSGSDAPTFPVTPSQPPFGLLPERDSSALMMSTMGGATCLIASLTAIAGFF